MKVYLAIGQHCWGRGDSAMQAKRNARKEGKPYKDGFAVYSTETNDETGVYMDEMGYAFNGGGEFVWVSGPDGLGKKKS